MHVFICSSSMAADKFRNIFVLLSIDHEMKSIDLYPENKVDNFGILNKHRELYFSITESMNG